MVVINVDEVLCSYIINTALFLLYMSNVCYILEGTENSKS